MAKIYEPREACIPAVRQELSQANAHVAAARDILKAHGFPETALDMDRVIAFVENYTKPDGMLKYLGRPDPEPSAEQQA